MLSDLAFTLDLASAGSAARTGGVPRFVRDRGIQFPPFGPDHLTSSLHHLAGPATLAAPA